MLRRSSRRLVVRHTWCRVFPPKHDRQALEARSSERVATGVLNVRCLDRRVGQDVGWVRRGWLSSVGAGLCDRLARRELRRAGSEEVGELIGGHWSCEQISLPEVAAEALQ